MRETCFSSASEGMGLFDGVRSLDMRGNCGQIVIDDLHSCSFFADIDIDGSQDTVSIDDHHNFPQALTARQAALAAVTCDAAIRSGRMDDLKVTNSLAILCRNALHFYQGVARTQANDGYTSPGGITTGSIANHDFDTIPLGVKHEAGTVTIVGGYCAAIRACDVYSGYLGFTGTTLPGGERRRVLQPDGGRPAGRQLTPDQRRQPLQARDDLRAARSASTATPMRTATRARSLPSR